MYFIYCYFSFYSDFVIEVRLGCQNRHYGLLSLGSLVFRVVG